MKKPEKSLADRAQNCRALPAATADERKIKTARPQHDLHFPLASSFFFSGSLLLLLLCVVSFLFCFLARPNEKGSPATLSCCCCFLFCYYLPAEGDGFYEKLKRVVAGKERRAMDIYLGLITLWKPTTMASMSERERSAPLNATWRWTRSRQTTEFTRA